ncbi:MAG: hypothetical protein J7L82_02870 [Staphylothermus sp.]|nr:hypothetical protein [Staphylothermus sp.]
MKGGLCRKPPVSEALSLLSRSWINPFMRGDPGECISGFFSTITEELPRFAPLMLEASDPL